MGIKKLWSRVGFTAVAVAVLTATSLALPTNSASAADIRSCQFGTGQVFDVQWSIAGSTLSVASMAYPFSNYGMFYPMPPATRFDATTLMAGDYFEFFDSTTVPGTLGLELHSSDGTLRGVVDDTGDFQALGNGFIFYIGDGSWGTLITTQQGFSYGDSATFTATNTAPTTADALAFTSCATAPVGQPVIGTAQPPTGKVGTAYTSFSVPATNGTGFTYAVTTGSLPTGLTLDPATGVISGTPTSAGASTFTITVTGATGTATAIYTISVAAAPAVARPAASSPELPVTGVDAALPLGIAVAAILAGTVLILLRRRRQL